MDIHGKTIMWVYVDLNYYYDMGIHGDSITMKIYILVIIWMSILLF